ncbi:hypothetical protein ACA910_009694 [Epithemia clementina (nom. ined.)]
MPPTRCTRNREASKRQIMSELSPNKIKTQQPLGRALPQCSVHDKKWVQSIYEEMEKRTGSLKDEYLREINMQQQVYASAMMKLPRTVKNMTVAEFNALYKANLLISLIKTLDALSTNSWKTSIPHESNLHTPAIAPKQPIETKTKITSPVRTVRKGEPIFSKNGSPVVEDAEASTNGKFGSDGALWFVSTATKAPLPGGAAGPRLLSSGLASQISVGNGEFIPLDNPSKDAIRKLAPDQLDETYLRLKMLKEQVDSAMEMFDEVHK